MKGNKDLHTARKNAADEFYTSPEDVSKELSLYPQETFSGKRVSCPCDDYTRSAFYAYFKENFHALHLDCLIAESLNPSLWVLYDGHKETVHHLSPTEGDFRSRTAAVHFDLCDIVVTNPPFSLFREFIRTVKAHSCHFIVLGNVNAITYSEILPGIVSRDITLGSTIRKGDREFLVPDEYPLEGTACSMRDGRKYIRVKGVRWFTDVRSSFPTELSVLTERYSPERYSKFDTYDAINVNTTAEIPFDYPGAMGVPITALDKSGPDGLIRFSCADGIVVYEVIGMLNSGNKPDVYDFAKPIIDGKCKFKRLLIRKLESD